MKASTEDTRLPTWTPSAERISSARLTDFAGWLRQHRGIDLDGYREIHQWSVVDLSTFWDCIREYFNVIGTGFSGPELAEERMPGALWYPESRLNFAENVLRPAQDPAFAHPVALLDIQEDDARSTMTWHELASAVAALAARLRELGVVAGDRVAAVLPNMPEAIIGLLAAASIGAIWTVNSPDLSPKATLDRLVQLGPKVLIAVDGYRFNGKEFDRLEHLAEVEAGLPSVEHTLLVRHLASAAGTGFMAAGSAGGGSPRADFASAAAGGAKPDYARVPFDHPL